jgi:tetrapyrrole methylase family protein/MazG family protein
LKSSSSSTDINPLIAIIRRLRGKGGCSWDRKQTPETMWKCLIEEVYELQEAIVKDDTEHICEEMGDVLFQLIFILEIFQENKRVSFEEVVNTVAKKMIRRHPHVYGEKNIADENELNRQWESIKADENREKKRSRSSVLDEVPKGMPSLLRAHKVSKSVVKQGFDWDSIQQVLQTAKDEIAEFEKALESNNQEEMMMEFGDVMFSLVNVARFARVHPETALAKSTAKFEARYRLMEKKLNLKKVQLKDLSRPEIDALWEQAKKDYDQQVKGLD